MLKLENTLIDINLNTKDKLIYSEILTIFKWSIISSNNIRISKRKLQLQAKKFKTNFDRDLASINSKIKNKMFYNKNEKKIEKVKLHTKGNKAFVQVPNWILKNELNNKDTKSKFKLNQCVLDSLFIYQILGFKKKEVVIVGYERFKKILNARLIDICGKDARQYSYDEVHKAHKYLEIYKLIKIVKNFSFGFPSNGFIAPKIIVFTKKLLTNLKIKKIEKKLVSESQKSTQDQEKEWELIFKKMGGSL